MLTEQLSSKFKEITGVSVRPQDFHLRDGHLLISPFGAEGVTFETDGSWEINEGDSFSIRFIQGHYEEYYAFGEFLKGVDFGSLKPAEIAEGDPLEEDIARWRFLEEELNIATRFLANYNAGIVAPSSYTLNTFCNTFVKLANMFLHGDETELSEGTSENTSDSKEETSPSTKADRDDDLPF